jgi:general secretion pathway protein K
MKNSQRGAALLAAMLTVTLVATIAAAALWQQWRSVEIESADRQRVQSTWILTGALDWARLILREDSGSVDHLAEPWAVPLQEARLSTFLAADPNNNAATQTSDAEGVFLSGDISDLQSRMNVTSLVQAGVVQQNWLEAFQRLFEVLGLPRDQLTTFVTNLRFASDISVDNLNAKQASLLPQRPEQLAWLGLPPETVALLQPYVTVLPQVTMVNLNTAPAEVIYAVGKNVSLADAQRLVAERERQAFRRAADVLPHLGAGASFDTALVSFSTRYFEVRGRLRIEQGVIEERSIVFRNGPTVQTVLRERGAFESIAAPARR